MSDLTERDELVALLHDYGDGGVWEHFGRTNAEAVADVLLAAGWSKADESEVEWGVLYGDGTVDGGTTDRKTAEHWITATRKRITEGMWDADDYEPMSLARRKVTPWQEVE